MGMALGRLNKTIRREGGYKNYSWLDDVRCAFLHSRVCFICLLQELVEVTPNHEHICNLEERKTILENVIPLHRNRSRLWTLEPTCVSEQKSVLVISSLRH